MSYDFIVIGAGVSGITSALTLARNGHRVALLEKAKRTAPLLRGFSREGVHFDTGFHYAGGLGGGGTLDCFFRYLGVDGIETFPFREDGFDLFGCAADRFEFRFPAGYDRIRQELSAAFPAERRAIERYLAQVQAVCAAMPYQNLDAPMESEAQLQRVFGPTLKETLDVLTDNALLKSLLCMHTLLYGVPSDEVSFAQHAVIVGNYYESAGGIRGGGAALAAAFDARLAEMGVEVFSGCRVSGIEAGNDGGFCGVRLENGDFISGTGCISTIHPRLLLDLLPDGALRPVYRKRLESLEESVSAYLAFAVCDQPVPALAGVNRFLVADADAIHRMGRTPIEEAPLYLSGAYRDPCTDPLGFIGIFPVDFCKPASWVASGRGRRPAGYREYKDAALASMQRRIEELSPDLAGNIRTIEASTPLTVRDFCDSRDGALYGVKHRVGQYNPLPATRMKGLYLAGQAVVAPGVMGAVLSGLLACGTVLGHEHLRKELKGCC
jgi:all-trans-retinol 13,14-reductase